MSTRTRANEAPYCGHYAWQVLKATLRQPGYATRAWATGTPHGRDGFARDFELERLPGHALYRASTRANLHNLPATFIEDLHLSGSLAEQEIEGRFVGFEGLVYPAFEIDRHVRPVSPVRVGSGGGESRGEGRGEGRGWARVVGGIDWGWTNPTAAVVFGLDGDGRAHQIAEWYQRRASLDEVIVPALVGLTRTHGVAEWVCDPEDPGHIAALARALAVAGLPCRALAAKKGPGSVASGIQVVTSLLGMRGDGRPGLLVDPRCVNTIAEYGVYRYATAPEGTAERRDPRDEPVKQGDHAMDATRYCLTHALGESARTEAYLAELQRRATG